MKLGEGKLRAAVIFCMSFTTGVAIILGSQFRLPKEAPPLKQDPLALFGLPKRPTNILIMGVDLTYEKQHNQSVPANLSYLYNANADSRIIPPMPTASSGRTDDSSFSGRTDTILLVHIDPEHGSVTGLNIPRDTIVTIAHHGIDKINSANAFGGPLLAKQTVSELTSVPVDHYFMLNLQGLINGVNELGGVTVKIPKKMSYTDWTAKLKIDLEPGVHTLTGNQAMGFVRFRHDQLGDIGRIQRQQIFMHALVDRITNPSCWTHMPQLLQIMQNSILTDLSQPELIQLINYAATVRRDQIQLVMLPGHFGLNGSWIPDTKAAHSLINQLFATPLPSRQTSTVDIPTQ